MTIVLIFCCPKLYCKRDSLTASETHEWFEFLDKGEEHEVVEDEFYDEVLVPLIESATELKHPENYSILKYESGEQMIHDEYTSPGTVTEIPILSTSNIRNLYEKGKILHSADITMGSANRVAEPSYFAFSSGNIESHAESRSTDAEMLERWVKVHEGTHLAQYNSINMYDIPFENANEIIEGHASFSSDKIMEEHFDWTMPELEGWSSWKRKTKDKFYRMNNDLEPYETGKEFFEDIYEMGGPEATATALTNPPIGDEIYNPEEWSYRIGLSN